ncbi:unnamed protein product [Cuscuta epithymum]|uniref:5-formyltetrahydrofolate cyclo-ligase n=1 Tax=Cuscuta epithymum TaxID=186058 RepID=A0AAV0FXF2_9ASTE|nr:unnamed protein product [Cuscuta epithymum]CAH9140311.1 unnamed protein product [Cuscuta epithymum]
MLEGMNPILIRTLLFSAVLLRPSPPRRCRLATMTTNQSCGATELDAIFAQKKALRSKLRRDIKFMDPFLRSQEDEEIQNAVLKASWFKDCKRLCAYISCSALREVDTSTILSEILQTQATDQKKLYVPRVEDKNRNMRMLNISSTQDLIANSMNILEPGLVDAEGNEREDVLLANEPVDLLLLPGLGFDKAGNRLGRGGGYYDTFLTKYQEQAKGQKWKQSLKVGLSYSVQLVDTIPVTPDDVLVDALVTPKGFLPISQAAQEFCV